MIVFDDGHREVHRMGESGAGNAFANYEVLTKPPTGSQIAVVSFQHDTIPAVGVVGVTNEALLAMVIDRLKCFQSSTFNCEENGHALDNCVAALAYLAERTEKRKARGVEGKHEV